MKLLEIYIRAIIEAKEDKTKEVHNEFMKIGKKLQQNFVKHITNDYAHYMSSKNVLKAPIVYKNEDGNTILTYILTESGHEAGMTEVLIYIAELDIVCIDKHTLFNRNISWTYENNTGNLTFVYFDTFKRLAKVVTTFDQLKVLMKQLGFKPVDY